MKQQLDRVEKVAQVLADVLGGAMDDYAVQEDNGKSLFEEAARAVIEAMRVTNEV